MCDIRAHWYVKPYVDFVSNNIYNGLPALKRCEASLSAGVGLCFSELIFLRYLRFRVYKSRLNVSELKDFLSELDTPIVREATSEENGFWKKFFSELKSNKA